MEGGLFSSCSTQSNFFPQTGQQMKILFQCNKIIRMLHRFIYRAHFLLWKHTLYNSDLQYLYSLHTAAQNEVYCQGGLFFCCAQRESFLVIATHKWLKSNDVNGLDCSSIHPHKERNHEQLSCANCFVFLAPNDFSGRHESAISII